MTEKSTLQKLAQLAERQATAACQRCAKKLPSSLKPVARHVAISSVGWEWKHYWAENAQLWLKQSDQTRRIKTSRLWGAPEDAVFEGWNRSEYAKQFMQHMARTNDLKKSSSHCLIILEQQLLALATRHYGYKARSTSYHPQFELGDFPQASVSLPLQLDEESTLEFLSWDRKTAHVHLDRVRVALGLIKTYSPSSYERFVALTKRIVPIKQKELVSYSLQTLPGHSFINLYHRDEIDLLDDLLHENGHHQLNLHLILGNLLREDPEQIYYSPWRRTLRPIRGIYHAHYTFFYALKLFHDLSVALMEKRLVWPSTLSPMQEQKIYFRFLEEWLMLDYTSEDLKRARRRGQITRQGFQVIQQIEKQRKAMKPIVKKIWPMLDRESLEALSALKVILTTQKKLTRSGKVGSASR